MEKSAAGGGAVATPVSELVCGEPGALSLTESVAASVPAEVGSNVTEMVQDAPAASVLPQVLVLIKAALLVPVRLMPAIASGALPGLVSIAFCVADVVPCRRSKSESEAGVRVAAGADGGGYRSAERDRLGRGWGIVGDLKRGHITAHPCPAKTNGNGATRTRGQRGSAGIGLREGPTRGLRRWTPAR